MREIIRPISILLVIALFLWLGIAPSNSFASSIPKQSPHQGALMSGYLPQRVYSSDEKRFSDFETLLSDAAKSDVLFVGEQHDDPATHRIELAVLEGLARRRTNVVLAMEMFERDVQPVVNDYLGGKISLEDFMNKSRPWPNFMSDYHFLV